MASSIQTLGHASLLVSDRQGAPLLITDPWLIGSAYWRSWWLQHYPSPAELENITQVKYAYLTHEHPDHLHVPSIRKIGHDATYLCPDLPDVSMSGFLRDQGFTVKTTDECVWMPLNDEISVLSLSLWNDDSILLIKTPTTLIINFNDAKPNKKIVARIREIRDSINCQKVVVLSSYSPASMVNSFVKDGTRVHVKNKKDYVEYLNGICTALKADFFMPFASQVVFLRSDSRWANEYKVSYEDLQTWWRTDCQLLHPYSTIDLETFAVSFVAEADYQSREAKDLPAIIKQEETEAASRMNPEDIKNLARKFGSSRWFSAPIFSKGIGFLCNDQALMFNPWTGKVREVSRGALDRCSFWLRIPPQSLKESLMNGHFGDLGITMFIEINLNGKTNSRLICVLFVLLTVDDYGHMQSIANFFRWMNSTVKRTLMSSPHIPMPN
jgi:hypothetical protein